MTDERAAFIAAIQAEQDDDVPRLVFADWLEEQGDPHGEFIRVQCQLASMERKTPACKTLREREATLLKIFDADWVQPLLQLGARGVYLRRGFVDEVRLDAALFVKHGDEVLRLAPALRVLNLRKSREHFTGLARMPQMERVRVLDLRMSRIGNSGNVLVRSPYVSKLEGLNLRGSEIGRDTVRTIVTSPYLAKLNHLSLGTNPQLGSSVELLTTWQYLSRLSHLELDSCDIYDVERLVTSDRWNPETLLTVNCRGAMSTVVDAEERHRTETRWANASLRLQNLGLRIDFYGLSNTANQDSSFVSK